MIVEINAIMKDLKDTGLVVPVIFSFNLPVCLLQKSDGPRRMA